MKSFLKKLIPFLIIFSLIYSFEAISHPSQVFAQTCPEGQVPFKDGCRPNTGTNLGAILDTGTDWLLAPFGNISLAILHLADWLVWLAGAILNYSVQYSVVNMKENIEAAGSVDRAWKVVRDVSNMVFIFVLLYAAIQTIIGRGKDTKQLIVSIVMVGVLMNFSLFFTKFVIDVSNIMAITFYDAIAPGSLTGTGEDWSSGGLSNVLMQPLRLQTIYDSVSPLDGKKLLIAGVMGTTLALIAAFVFFAVAIMFIIRFVVLIFVLVLSPIAFIASILPQAEPYRKDWTNALIGQAFFAPIYFLLTWIVIVISRGVLTNKGSIGAVLQGMTGQNGEVVAPPPSDVGVFVNFLILIVLMVASLMIAKEWAGKAPGGVGKLTSWAMGAAGSTTLGIAGRFGRGTFGRVGQQIADSKYLKDRPGSLAARMTLAAGRKTAGASFDLRNAGFADQLGAGKGNKGGFADDMKQKTKEEKEYADQFKPSDLEISQAERTLEDKKKNGTLAEIRAAQTVVDELKGVNEEEARKREAQELINQRALHGEYINEKEAMKRIKQQEGRRLGEITRLTMQNPTMTRKTAEEEIDRRIAAGELEGALKLKTEKGAGNERKEAYAKSRETPARFSITGRVGVIGRVKKERQAFAAEVRKSMKEKKSADKIVEAIQNEARDAADESGSGTATPPPIPPGEAATQAGPLTS